MLLIEGALQKRDGTISVKARRFEAVDADAMTQSLGPTGGARVATAEARLVDDGERLYAHGTSTCIVLPPAGR